MTSGPRPWERGVALLLAAWMTVSFTSREASAARPRVAPASATREAQARALGVKSELLANPAAVRSDEEKATALRRLDALRRMREYARTPEADARAQKARADADGVRTRQESQRLQRNLAKSRLLKLPEAKVKAEALRESPKLAREIASAGAAKKLRTPGSPKLRLPTQDKGPQPNRTAPRQKPEFGAVPREVEALYASVSGEGAKVLLPDGSLVAAELARATEARRTSRQTVLAGLLSDLGLPLPVLGALPAPLPEDLAETAETARTPGIVALAAQLQGDPLKLFNFVHTQLEPALYYGSKLGADQALRTRRGNDFDTASLLIALLRASNIPARYEYGTVRLTLAQAQALTGGATAQEAAYQLSQAGIPAGIGSGGQSVLMERAWVRAYLPYGEYKGTGPKTGEPVWVRLDPGLKRTVWPQTAPDLRGLATFDFNAFLAAPTSKTPLDIYEVQLLNAARAQNLCNNLASALFAPALAEEPLRLLPSESPAKVETSLLVFARPPASFRWGVDVAVDGVARHFELAELQGHQLALRFPGATASDVAAIAAAGGIINVTPFQVRVVGSLRLDGVELQRFPPVIPGTDSELSLTASVPGGSAVAVSHRLVAGGSYAVSVTAGPQDAKRGDALRSALGAKTGDDFTEAAGHAVNALYAHHQEDAARRLTQLTRHALVEDVLESVAGRELRVQEAFGVPVALAYGNYFIDARRDSLTPVGRDGKTAQVAHHVRLLSMHGSILENVVWEEVFASKAVSAVKAIQAASPLAIPILTINAGGTTVGLTGYSQLTLDDMAQALGAGWQVVAPQRPVTYAQYPDVEAYLLLNPITGAGANKIGGLLNGGESSGPETTTGPGECVACAAARQQVNSTVNFATGNLLESRTDLTLPAIGLPIVFSRTYSSREPLLTELGYGWMHSYGVQLRLEGNGDVTWLNEELLEARFTKVGAAFTAPAGWQYTLTQAGGTYTLRHKTGLTWSFDSAGRLTSMADTSGNATTLVYSGSQLMQVKDSSNVVALSFTYTGAKLTRVTDKTGRHVDFSFTGDDLTSASDALGHAELYGYDSVHNLTSRTDKRGKVFQSFYDLQDRWVGSRDALGAESQLVHDSINRKAVYFDKTGAARAYEFTAGGSPTSMTDSNGNRTELEWDGNFNQTKMTDARGLSATMTYDGKGNLTRRVRPDDVVETLTYEQTFSNLLRQSSTLTNGFTSLPGVTNTYDAAGRLLTRTPDFLPASSNTYDGRGQLATATQPGGATTIFNHNASGLVTSVVDPTSRTTSMGFDAAGHLTSTTDGAGKTRTLEIDAMGRVNAMVDALGNRSESTYDDEGNRLTSKDPEGRVSLMAYDGDGRMTSVTDALGHTSRTEFDTEGRVTATVDAVGNRSVRKYDIGGRLVEVTDAAGFSTTQAYCADVATSPCAEVDALGHLTTRTFDAGGRLLTEVDALGRVSATVYDFGKRPLSRSGPMQVPTSFEYGDNGFLTVENTPTLRNFMGYDSRGNRTALTAFNGTGRSTSWTFDLANRVLTENNALGFSTVMTYDAAGRRFTKRDGNNQLTTYSYSDSGQLLSVLFSDGTKYEFAFDSRGNRTLEKSPTHERHLVYDELSRLSHVDDITLGRSIDYGFDERGNRTSITEGGVVQRFVYDSRNLLISAQTGNGPLIHLQHDALGRRTAVIRPNGVRSDWTFDDAGQVVSITHVKGGAALLGFAYENDPRGMRTKKTREDGTSESYGFDAALRLTDVRYSSGRGIAYVLDAWGNRRTVYDTAQPVNYTQQEYTTNAFNQVTDILPIFATPTTFVYDNNGNTLSETTGAAVTTFGWDKDNRLRSVTQAGPVLSTFEYDANGIRTKKNEAGVETRYLLTGSTVLEELDGSGATKTTFLNNPQAVDDVFSMNIGGQVVYPLTDALGSLYALTDSSGAVVRRQEFEVYGKRTSSTGTGPATDRAFTSREEDLWGGDYNRDRSRHLRLGSWLQPDRAGLIDGPNRYLYARAVPTTNVDQTGELAMLMYGNPNRVIGLTAVTRSGRVIPDWFLTEGNWVGYRDAAKEYISRRFSIPIGDIRAFPLWTPEHAAAIERLTTAYDPVIYFGHGAGDRLIGDYVAYQTVQGGWLDLVDVATLVVRNPSRPPHRVILEGCFTSTLASALEAQLRSQFALYESRIEGQSSALSIRISVEDDAQQTPYRLDVLNR